jgi:type IV fimbrial biogenesis protein FimT
VRKACGGFTLVELMVTVVMAALLLTLGIPSLQILVNDNRLTTATNDFIAALNLARSEAIKRGVRVTLCKSSNRTSCANTGNWAQGWMLFTDPNNNASYDTGETLIQSREGMEGNLSVTGNTTVADYISYAARGQSVLINGGFQAGTITVCDGRNGNVGKGIVLSKAGRVQIASGASCS